MKYRIEHNVHRPDMINILIDAQKQSMNKWTDEEIVAQCFAFLFAGFESTSTFISFAAHELVENPECQDKLIEEVQNVKRNLHDKPLNYETLHEMKYMDMVLSETLRKWPPIMVFDHSCNKPCVLKSGDFSLKANVGDLFWINLVGLHYDPKLFPNPKKFDPERFSDENKENIKPFSYGPFGFGPRTCIANRLALMEAKAILFHILLEFKFEKCDKTQIPVRLAKGGFLLKAENGLWMKLVKRT